MAIKIPRNLHYALILFLGALMLIGFLIKGLSEPAPQTRKPDTKEAETTPDQSALIAEIKRQNDAALEAERALREKEMALERAKRELDDKERSLSGRPAATPASDGKSQVNEKELERKEAAAVSKVIALRDQGQLGVPGVGNLSLNTGGADPSAQPGQPGGASSFEDRYQSMREALGQPQKADDRNGNERWMDRMGQGSQEQAAVIASSARKGVVVHEGTAIRAVLLSRINSDLPGMITARVLNDIYDTQTGLKLAVPAGSRLVGRYNSNVQDGQRRVMAAFHRIILPDGRSLYLKAAGGTDGQGTSGIPGAVDTHFWEMLGSQLLVATVAWAMEPTPSSDSGTTVNVYGGGSSGSDQLSAHGEVLVDAAKKLAKPYENRKPTITVEPGATFNILANQDLLLSGGNQP